MEIALVSSKLLLRMAICCSELR